MEPLPFETALIVIDVQTGFDDPRWGARSNPGAETNVAALLDAWRRAGRPVFHIQHLSTLPGSVFAPSSPGSALKDGVLPQPGEPLITKNVNSAFIGTDLEERLRSRGITHVVMTGLTTDHCVSTTTRMAANLGFTAFFVTDATATFERTSFDGRHFTAEEMHAAAVASLHGEFAVIVTTRQLLDDASATQRGSA